MCAFLIQNGFDVDASRDEMGAIHSSVDAYLRHGLGADDSELGALQAGLLDTVDHG